ncbi:MAG: hypothetical protein ACRETI_08630 [Steroidobacteraceae bacterium]
MIVRMWHGRVPTSKAHAYRAFAGDDLEQAKYYPEDADFLLEYEPRVVHYQVVGKS